MRNFRAVRRHSWSWFLAGFWLISASCLASVDALTDEQAEQRRIALAHLADGSLALALTPLETLVGALPTDSWAGAEARLYRDYAALSLDLLRNEQDHWIPLARDPWGKRRETLREEARQLREIAPERSIWQSAYRRIGQLEVFYRWEGNDDLLGAYEPLFEFWAESTDLPAARRAYLDLVWELDVETQLDFDRHQALGPYVENAASIAREFDDVRRFSWLWAQWLERHPDGPGDHVRRGVALRKAIDGPDDGDLDQLARALLDFGEWASRFGHDYFAENGELRFEPDWATAVRAYERILGLPVDAIGPQLRMRAEEELAAIREPNLDIFVPAQFRPDTEVNFLVRWRNLERPTIFLWPVPVEDLSAGFFNEWKDFTPPPGTLPLVDLDMENEPESPYHPVRERVRISQSLEPGAYLIEARAEGRIERALLLVNDLVTVFHRTDNDWTLFVGDPDSGAPVEGAQLIQIVHWDGKGDDVVVRNVSNAEGLTEFTVDESERAGGYTQRFIASTPDRGVTLAESYGYSRADTVDQRMVIYTLTDRLLYRPGETVEGKAWVRFPSAEGWLLPEEGSTFHYNLRAPNGDVIQTGRPVLAENGAVDFSFSLPEEAALGAYQLEYEVTDPKSGVSQSWWESPFRVEAFRTPDVLARIELEPPPTGSRLIGDIVRGQVAAEFYAGGVVENAAVELVVRRRPFWRAHPFADSQSGTTRTRLMPRPWFGGGGEEIARLSLKTDNQGRASFEFPTRGDGEHGWVYALEARVRDLSRREVTAEREVILPQQTHFVDLDLRRRLINPGDRAELVLHSVSPDGEPVPDEGILRVTRERWREIYVHRRRGDEISGDEYRDLPERSLLLAAQSDYDLRDAGFVTEEVLETELKTGRDGRADFAFEPSEAGYYRFNWVSRARRGQPVLAETPLWVSDQATTEIGYRPGGIEIISDRGPHRVGEPIPFLLSAPEEGRTVLLSFSGKRRTETRVVHLEGTSVMGFFTPTTAHQPNAFAEATMISHEAVFEDSFEWKIPEQNRFLEVSVEPDADGYEPRDEAKLTVRVRDAEGKPVATEVTVAVTDEALFGLLGEERARPAEAFYHQQNHNLVQVGSSLAGRPYFNPLDEGWEQSGTGESGSRVFGAMPMDAPTFAQVEFAADKNAAAPPERPVLASPRFTRTDFRPTALWQASVQTDESGVGEVSFTFPDNLTAWRAEAFAITRETRVGQASAATTTRLPLIVRLQAPRFLTVRDEVVLGGTFQNNSEQTETIHATLQSTDNLELLGKEVAQSVDVPPGGVGRLEWPAKVLAEGTVHLTLTGATERAADAMEWEIPAVPHGFALTEGGFGRSPGGAVELAIDLGEAETLEAETLRIRATPTIATELFSALPFLIEFPYGCTEQTISRFLPALAVRSAVRDLGYPLGEIDGLVFGGLTTEAIEGRKDLSAVLDKVIADSVERLRRMQLEDGSFPWLEGGRSDAYMTAYAVYALTLAENLGVDLDGIDLEAAREWLERTVIEGTTSRPALQAWMLHALASRYRAEGYGRPSRLEAKAFLRLMEKRDSLGAFQLALLALAAKDFGFVEDAELLLRNLANFAITDEATLKTLRDASGRPLPVKTIHWGKRTGYYRWEEGAVETTAFVLQALLAVRPDDPQITPAVNWLVRNRTGATWGNTRATTLCILALSDYLGAEATGLRDSSWTVVVNGVPAELPPAFLSQSPDAWQPPLDFEIPRDLLRTGANTIELRRTDEDRNAPFYVSWTRSWFAEEDPIPEASNELAVSRAYEHLMPVPTLLRGVKEETRVLREGDEVTSGDRIEVILTLETPRELRYVLLQDLKPSGFETVQLLSGMNAWLEPLPNAEGEGTDGNLAETRRLPVYQELRDRSVGFLIDRLPAGKWQIRYRLRAESPGEFHALPAQVEAFYLNDVRGNAAEQRIQVGAERDVTSGD